jgi:rhomboid protease GluP
LKLEILLRLLATLFVAVAAIGCAMQLYPFSRPMRKRAPIIAIAIIGLTAVITGLQFIFPEVLTAFRRNRGALLAGEWWRIVTPLFVQAYGWWHACVNGVAAVGLFPLAERLYGKRLLLLYFVPGVFGEIFAYLWSPTGAGSSLGIAGVMGGLFAYTFLRRQVVPRSSRLFAMCGIAGAVVQCLARDIHGPPILLGVLLASMMTTFCPSTEQ